MQILRFDMDAVRRLVGPADYARGEDYFREGRVTIVELDPGGISAQAEGASTYTLKVRHGVEELEGHCSCRRFADVGFCKHMVATALLTNDILDDAVDDAPPPTASAGPRIRAHLAARGVDALVDLVMDLAKRDPALLQRLEIAAIDADDPALEKRLRKALDKAIRVDFDRDWSEENWVDGVANVLDPIDDLVSTRPAVALRLIDHALARLVEALGSFDDSSGGCYGLLERVSEMHLAATRLEGPDHAALARDLFEREIDGEWDTFHNASSRYADVLGPEGLKAHRALVEAAWAKLPPLSPTKTIESDRASLYSKLACSMPRRNEPATTTCASRFEPRP